MAKFCELKSGFKNQQEAFCNCNKLHALVVETHIILPSLIATNSKPFMEEQFIQEHLKLLKIIC
jgi:hypothetical protein